MRTRALRMATWAFSWLAPRSQREALLGDLAEEFALRAGAASAAAACRWYLRQMCASATPLLWSRLTRTAWIATAGTALLAYIAVGLVEFMVHWAMAGSSLTGGDAFDPVGMIITFPMVVLIACCAARLRRAAPFVLGTIMLLNVTAMTLWANEHVPTGYAIAYFIVGPVAALLGGALNSQRGARSSR
ncbi:MAG TPA: hypothetical protein VHW25_09755 [Steroidobacteraceae bacterium]|nr:hypothetical protein [Steroidobacteraceae bacterium]